MASAKKNSSSKSRSTSGKPVAPEPENLAQARFAICMRNEGYEASLELRKLYPVIEDRFGNEHGMIRVIDESGEDYLFPSEYFVRVSLPQTIERKLRKIA
jgi:hypothetical protein